MKVTCLSYGECIGRILSPILNAEDGLHAAQGEAQGELRIHPKKSGLKNESIPRMEETE